MSDFETLIRGKGYSSSERWYPNFKIEQYEKAFSKLHGNVGKKRALAKNLSYNTQYLEFLDKELSELVLPPVIKMELIKTYVLTGMAILEGLFEHIVESHEWCKKPTNLKKSIEILEAHQTELPFPSSCYSELQELRKYRNRIHLYLRNAEGDTDHDFNAFYLDYKKQNIRKKICHALYVILTSDVVTDHPECFDFLKDKS